MNTSHLASLSMVFILVLFSQLARAADTKCFEQASVRYGIPEELLRAISHVESRGNPSARNTNKNGSMDYGHMQINSYWLPTLGKYGITKSKLMHPCTNTHVGAWVLANNISRMGYRWEAIGAYNSTKPARAATYMRKVALALKSLDKKTGDRK